MEDQTHLYILWTNADPITSEKMVFMYTINSLIHGWWENVTLIIWGATAKLVSEDTAIKKGKRSLRCRSSCYSMQSMRGSIGCQRYIGKTQY
jgi:hypothetical protein